MIPFGLSRPNYLRERLFVHECRCMAASAQRLWHGPFITVEATAGMTDSSEPLRVLLSEGSSTSAREAITILGLSGHHVEICDPNPLCLGRYSRFVRKFHHCPALRDNPYGYLVFVEELLSERHVDVLLPTHEQGFLFARVAERLRPHAGLALLSFASYRTAHNKAGFSRLLEALSLPQPATCIVTSESELRAATHFPAMVKTSIGTASRGIWLVRCEGDLDRAVADLNAGGTGLQILVLTRFRCANQGPLRWKTLWLLQRLVIGALAVMLRGRDVAILDLVVRDGRRLLRFVFVLLRRLVLLAVGAHAIP
jgi:hypothetical protein